MAKEFKSHNQQLKVLRRKGLQVPSGKPKRILEKEGFYQVINGYKDLFLSTKKLQQQRRHLPMDHNSRKLKRFIILTLI